MLFTGKLTVIEGTKIFSGCSDSNIAQVMAQTLTGPSIFQIGSSNYVSSSVPSAPHVTSVITTDCYQVPVTGNLTITLSGLPSGSWTLHGDNASNYTYSGFGTTAVLNIDSSIVGTGMHFYYDGPTQQLRFCNVTSGHNNRNPHL